MAKRGEPKLDFGKDTATRAELVGQFRREDFKDFWRRWEDEIRSKSAADSPVKLYAMFQVYYRAKILEALPELGGTDAAGFRVPEHALNQLLHRIMPGYNQFIEIYLENYEPPVPTTQVELNTVTRARAREEIPVLERRNKDISDNPEDGHDAL